MSRLTWMIVLCAAALLTVACDSGDADRETAGKPATAESAVDPLDDLDPEATGDALVLPPPPPPAPALNQFAEQCSTVGPPAPEDDMHRYAAVCFGALLEVLRVSLMPAGLTPETAGTELDAAEVAVNRLALRQGEGLGTPAERAATAADAANRLLAVLVAAVEEGDPAFVEEARIAATALDGAAPLDAQGAELAAYFAATDRAVRPVVRALGSPTP